MRIDRPRRRASAGILAAMLLFVMLFTVGTSYVIFMNSVNTVYTQNLVAQTGRTQALGNEGLQLTSVLSPSGHVSFYANNTSSLRVNITGVLVLDSSGNILKCDGVGLPVGASCGNTTPALPVPVNRGKGSAILDTGYTYTSGTVAIEAFTSRGNTFTATFPQTGPPYASQAMSIGALTANIQTFKWMKPTGDSQTGALVGGYPVTGISPFPEFYTAVTITNNQGSATPTPFQQKVTWVPSSYKTYEASDLGNIRFCQDTACSQPLYAWLESCSSFTSCSYNSGTATAWVQLTSSIAGSGGTLTIYMVFTPTGTDFDGNYWGESPLLSTTYGYYDNGAKVFNFYDNFAGTQLSSVWGTPISSQGTVSLRNGARFNTSSSSGYVFIESPLTSYPQVAEAYAYSRGSGTDPLMGVATSINHNNWIALYNGYSVDYFSNTFYYVVEKSSGGTSVQTNSESFPAGIWGVTWSATGTASGSDGTNTYSGAGSSPPSIANYGIYLGQSNSGTGSDNFKWVRMRAFPPGNVMPSASLGTLVATGGSQVIFSVTFTDNDAQGRGVTLWPESCLAVVTVAAGTQQTTTVLSFYIVNGLNNANYPTGIVAYNSTTSEDFTHLNYNSPTTVYFGASVPKGSTMVPIQTPPSPFMILVSLSGQFDDKTLYGQTIAFPSGIATTTSGALSQFSGGNQTAVTVTGNGFTPGVKGIVGWMSSNGQVVHLTTFTTTSGGTLGTSGVTFTIPNTKAGYYTIVVTDFTNCIFFTFSHT